MSRRRRGKGPRLNKRGGATVTHPEGTRAEFDALPLRRKIGMAEYLSSMNYSADAVAMIVAPNEARWFPTEWFNAL